MTVKTVQNPSSTTYTPPIGAIGSSTTYTISGGGGGGGVNGLSTGGSGGTGYLSNTGSLSWVTQPTTTTLNSHLQITPTDGSDAIIQTNHNEINLDKLYKTVMMIADKMMIIADDPYFTQKYPTLKDAYEQYQTLLEIYKQGE